jgi:hypothetical protein
MIHAHYINEAEQTFDGLTARELAIYQMGTDHGKSIKADQLQATVSRLDLTKAELRTRSGLFPDPFRTNQGRDCNAQKLNYEI